jgi:hypothetical protein
VDQIAGLALGPPSWAPHLGSWVPVLDYVWPVLGYVLLVLACAAAALIP